MANRPHFEGPFLVNPEESFWIRNLDDELPRLGKLLPLVEYTRSILGEYRELETWNFFLLNSPVPKAWIREVNGDLRREFLKSYNIYIRNERGEFELVSDGLSNDIYGFSRHGCERGRPVYEKPRELPEHVVTLLLERWQDLRLTILT
jgi:hypothetical protein